MSDEYLHPNLNHRTLWWLHCTHCGVASYNGAVTRFASIEQLWLTMLSRGWTQRDDGRVLCPLHSRLADCERDGHAVTPWMSHPIEPDDLEWRFCRNCGSDFSQRLRSGWRA